VRWSVSATAAPSSCRSETWTVITLGSRADFDDRPAAIFPTTAWLGRVIDGFGNPTDGKGPLPVGPESYPLKANPPPASSRARVGAKMDLGVRAMNAFTTLCQGQRMGIFAGSGVGKSTLMAMPRAQFRCGCHCYCARRRTRPRSEGIHRRRSRRGRPCAFGRCRRDIG